MENNFKDVSPSKHYVIIDDPESNTWTLKEESNTPTWCYKASSSQGTPEKKHYTDYIEELIKSNEKYNYKYLARLRYSERTYQAFCNAMETQWATPIDLFVHSLIFRAEAINDGFDTLIKQGNYLCANAMVRMQVDNLLIAWAGLACKNRDKFFEYYNSGKPINRLTDHDGNLLTQGYIVKSYAKIDPRIMHIYNAASDYIHPSHRTQKDSTDLNNHIQLLSYKEYQPQPYEGICGERGDNAMVRANNALCNLLYRWVLLKHGKDLGISNIKESDYFYDAWHEEIRKSR